MLPRELDSYKNERHKTEFTVTYYLFKFSEVCLEI